MAFIEIGVIIIKILLVILGWELGGFIIKLIIKKNRDGISK